MIFTRIKNWLSRVFRQTSANTPETVAATPPTSEATPNLDDDDSYDEYSQKVSGLDDIVVKLGVHKRISASHKYMYEMGRRDGSLGVSLNITDIAKATAQSMFRHIFVILKGKLGSLGAQLQSEKNIMDVEENSYKREQAYYDYMKYQYRFFPRNYSFLLFIIYLLVAIALILADMPLALKLIQKGFDIEGPGFGELFEHGKFWSTIAANWETAITAIGIALCTVYIKIYYDEFVGTPYANRLMSFKKFLEENGIELHEETQKNIHREAIIKTIIKTLLVVVTVVCIIILARFRYQTSALDGSPMTSLTGWAFLGITLLFPLIGGVCLSYALNNLQNRVRLIRAKHNCRRRLGVLRTRVQEYTQAKTNYEDLDAAAARLGDEIRMVEEYKHYLVAFYERGYAIGAMQPEKYAKGEEFYTKILEWRNIAISRRINHSINKLN
jgi:hypothetical protein